MERRIILDVETTGMHPSEGDRIIELAALEMVERTLTGNAFHQYYNPEHPIHPQAQAIHGISNEQVACEPLFSECLQQFIEFVDGAELVIHNAPFDVSFINAELQRANHPKTINQHCTITCTLAMARKKVSGKHNLDALCEHFGVNNSNRELHGALIDCDLLAQVYIHITSGQSNLFKEDMRNSERIRSTRYEGIKLEAVPVSEEQIRQHKAYMANLKNAITPIWQTDS